MKKKNQQNQSYQIESEQQKKAKKKSKGKIRYQQELSQQNKKVDKKKPRETQKIEKMYLLATVRYSMENKFQKISWGNTKPDKFFVKVAEYFSGIRNKTQIKSLDQRLKKKYYEHKNKPLDIFDVIKIQLPKHQLTIQEREMFQEFVSKYQQGNHCTWKEQFIVELERSAKERDQEYVELKDIIRSWRTLQGNTYHLQEF